MSSVKWITLTEASPNSCRYNQIVMTNGRTILAFLVSPIAVPISATVTTLPSEKRHFLGKSARLVLDLLGLGHSDRVSCRDRARDRYLGNVQASQDSVPVGIRTSRGHDGMACTRSHEAEPVDFQCSFLGWCNSRRLLCPLVSRHCGARRERLSNVAGAALRGYGFPSRMCSTSLLFSLHTYSMISQSGCNSSA